MIYKNILSTLFLFAFLGQMLAQKPQVKSIRHEFYEPAANKEELQLVKRHEKQFNQSGQIVRQDYYTADTSNSLQAQKKIVNSYDNRGRHLNTLQYNADNNLELETKIYWDEQGNKVRVEDINYNKGQQTSLTVSYLLEFDEKGNKKKEKYFDKEGNILSQKEWEYNKLDEIVRMKTFSTPKNQPERSTSVKYKHDKDGNLQKSISVEYVNRKEFRKDVVYFNSNYVVRWKKYLNGKFDSEFFNEYRDSVIIRTTTRNRRKIISPRQDERYRRKMERRKRKNAKRKKNEEIWVTNTEYDAYGNILVTTKSIDDKVVLVTQYNYDDYGNKTRLSNYDKENNIKEEDRYAYDDYGNITKKITLRNNRVLSEERKIYTYFDKD